MQYSIIATVGPASHSEMIWQKMLDAGVDGLRLNTSHMTLANISDWLDRLHPCLLGQNVSIIIDLQGSKWRLGVFDAFELEIGQSILLVYGTGVSQPGVLPVPHEDFFTAAALSTGEILLDDSKCALIIQKCGSDWVRARVVRAGSISSNKGIALIPSQFRMERISQKDWDIWENARDFPGVKFAISYVRDAEEMAKYRILFGSNTYLIAKLERQPAISQARELCKDANELWICRGDLGAELGLCEMAEAVFTFPLPGTLPVPVFMAGQVLEHMTNHPSPTRSEICYLHDMLHNGFSGVVLSDETAIGKYPLETCQMAGIFR